MAIDTADELSAPYAIRQFEIERLVPVEIFGVDLSLTNSAVSMISTVLAIAGVMYLAIRRLRMVPGRRQAAAELVYEAVARTVLTTAGPAARPHIPFFFTLFVYILVGSVVGLLPIKFTFTSHLIVTFGLAVMVFIYVTTVGFRVHGLGFFGVLLPSGTPLYIAPLIVIIEAISYLFRPVTLGVRLFANVLAGHMIVKLFANFVEMLATALGAAGLVFGIVPVLLVVIFLLFEIMVFLIQSYIFLLLGCIYLRSSLEGH